MYNVSVDECLEQLDSRATGLTTATAKRRLEENGKNLLKQKKKRNLFLRILDQLKNVLLLLLVFACIASIVVSVLEQDAGELVNAGMIMLIIILLRILISMTIMIMIIMILILIIYDSYSFNDYYYSSSYTN